MLFHISEESTITSFEPRASEFTSDPVVWAIDTTRLHNYLLPRECPRVTYYADGKTSNVDIDRFLGATKAVIAIESIWLRRVHSCRLYCYCLPSETFELIDECAGYYVSRMAVSAESVKVFDDLIIEIARREVELRIMSNLWQLHDAVYESSLQFSMIRMRNALPRIVKNTVITET